MPPEPHIITGFSAAADGWRAAFKWSDVKEIIVVPIIGWATRTEGVCRTEVGHFEVEPVILCNNVGEPLVTTVADSLHDWADGEELHQVIAPGFDVREVPDRWKVREYPD